MKRERRGGQRPENEGETREVGGRGCGHPTYTRRVPDAPRHLVNDAPGRGRVSHVSSAVHGHGTHGPQASGEKRQKERQAGDESHSHPQVTMQLTTTTVPTLYVHGPRDTLFFFPLFGSPAASGPPGLGIGSQPQSDPSRGNTRSLNPLCRAGDSNPCPRAPKTTRIPLHHSRSSPRDTRRFQHSAKKSLEMAKKACWL